MNGSAFNQLQDAHMARLAKGRAEGMRPDAYRAPANPGLIDVSAFLTARGGAKMIKDVPAVTRFAEKYIPDPKIWQATRDAKNSIFNDAMVAGSA